jgi:hypothetical protein
MCHASEQLEYRYSMREKTNGEEFSNLITIHLFELPRMKKATMAGLSPMEGWLFLLKNLHTFPLQIRKRSLFYVGERLSLCVRGHIGTSPEVAFGRTVR